MLPGSKTHAPELPHHLVDDRVDVKAVSLVYLNVYTLVLTSVSHIVIGDVYNLSKDVRTKVVALLLHIGLMVQIYQVGTILSGLLCLLLLVYGILDEGLSLSSEAVNVLLSCSSLVRPKRVCLLSHHVLNH